MWGQISNEKTHIIPTKVNKLNNKIIDCSIGKFSYSAIDCTGMVWVWGDNKYSQLGLNDYTNRPSPYPLSSLKDKNVNCLVFGENFALAYQNTLIRS